MIFKYKMEDFNQQFNKKAKQISLTASERNELRESILVYMDYHPLTESQGLPKRKKKDVQNFFQSQINNGWFWVKASGVTAMFFIMVVPLLAERSLPGDVLYPIKVSFNEELRGALVSSPYQKIEWETERLERRVSEVKLLADSGKLTTSAEADVAKAMRQHSNAAKQSIESIRESNSDDASIANIALASTLDISAEMLSGRVATGSATSSAMVDAVSEARASMVLVGNNVSYDNLMSRIESETTRAYEYLNGISASISSSDKQAIERRLEDVKGRVESATELRERDGAAAVSALVEALSSTNKVMVFMTNLELRKTVAIEKLIPSVPTKSEESELLKVKLSDISLTASKIDTAISELATTSEGYSDMVLQMKEYKEMSSSSLNMLEKGELQNAKESVANIMKKVDQVIVNLKLVGVEIK